MRKSNSKIILICSILVIIAMGAGIFIGFLIGKSSNKDNSTNSQTEGIDNINGDLSVETIPESSSESKPEEEPQSTEETDETFVLSVGNQRVYLEEINYHLYQLRDYYVEEYGEEPWEVVMDDGRTVKEYAKEQLLSELIETQILIDKAEEYNVELTESQLAIFTSEAQAYIDKIGPDIADMFGITHAAVEKVFKDNEIKLRVKSEIMDGITDELSKDSANAELSESDLALKLEEEYQKLIASWKDSYNIVIGDQWDNIVIGSAG